MEKKKMQADKKRKDRDTGNKRKDSQLEWGEKRMKAKKYLLFFLLGYCIYVAIEVTYRG